MNDVASGATDSPNAALELDTFDGDDSEAEDGQEDDNEEEAAEEEEEEVDKEGAAAADAAADNDDDGNDDEEAEEDVGELIPGNRLEPAVARMALEGDTAGDTWEAPDL